MKLIEEDKEKYCIVFIHFYSASRSLSLSEALPTTAIDTVPEFTREALEAIAGKGLAQGPYMAARARFEPTTLWLNGIVSTNVPPCPTKCSNGQNMRSQR